MLGRNPKINPSQAPIYTIGPAICDFVVTVTSAILIYALNLNSLEDGLQFAFMAGVGYLFTNTINIAINPNILKPFAYGFITGGYHLVGIILVSLFTISK